MNVFASISSAASSSSSQFAKTNLRDGGSLRDTGRSQANGTCQVFGNTVYSAFADGYLGNDRTNPQGPNSPIVQLRQGWVQLIWMDSSSAPFQLTDVLNGYAAPAGLQRAIFAIRNGDLDLTAGSSPSDFPPLS